jgi:hypothetical protein
MSLMTFSVKDTPFSRNSVIVEGEMPPQFRLIERSAFSSVHVRRSTREDLAGGCVASILCMRVSASAATGRGAAEVFAFVANFGFGRPPAFAAAFGRAMSQRLANARVVQLFAQLLLEVSRQIE